MLKVLLKYLGVLVVSVLVSVFISATVVSYQVVKFINTNAQELQASAPPIAVKKFEHLDQPAQSEFNLHEVLRLTSKAIDELDHAEKVLGQISTATKKPELCTTLCNPSSFDSEKAIAENSKYFDKFYATEKSQALQDPGFRIKVEQFNLLTQSVPKHVRSLMDELIKAEKLSWGKNLSMALRLEVAALTELPHLESRISDFKSGQDRITNLKSLIKTCQSGAQPKKSVIKDCEQL